jgi:hypothetical protein
MSNQVVNQTTDQIMILSRNNHSNENVNWKIEEEGETKCPLTNSFVTHKIRPYGII